MSAVSFIDTNNSDDREEVINIPEVLTSYVTNADPEVRKQFGSALCQILKKQSLEDILTNIHEFIAAILIVSEDKCSKVRAGLVLHIPFIFLQCHEHACPDLEDYLYDRLLQIVIKYLGDEENDVSGDAYSALYALLDKYVLDKKRIEEKICPAIICPIHKINYDTLKESNLNSTLLMRRIAPIIGPEKTEELFLDNFIELCKCSINSVRKACVTIFPTICYVLGPKLTEDKLLDIFLQLCSDPFWGVRKACAQSIALISLICSLECRRNRIAPVILKLAKDSSQWVTSTTFKILGQFISSFAQPCITGLAYTYNGELLITNPVDPDFRDHSDPQTLANYEHYLKMFTNNETFEDENIQKEATPNLNNSENTNDTNNSNNINKNSTPENIAKLIIENKDKLRQQIFENACFKPKYFKDLVFKNYINDKYGDLHSGNNNLTNNSNEDNDNEDSDGLLRKLSDIKNIEIILKDDNSLDLISPGTQSEISEINKCTTNEMNTSTNQELEQLQTENNQEQNTNEEEKPVIPDSSNGNSTRTSDDNNILDNIFESENSSLEVNLHRRRHHRRNVYNFWRKNTPSDLQLIIKKAIHDVEENFKPRLPPPPPHPLKLPTTNSSISTTSSSSCTNTSESQMENHMKSDLNELLNFDKLLQEKLTPEAFKKAISNGIENSVDKINNALSFTNKNSENDFNETKPNNENIFSSSDNNSSNMNNDSNLYNISNIDTDLYSASRNLCEKKDKNGNEEDDASSEFNSYKFWNISPEMPLDSNIVGNMKTWNMKSLNDTLPTSNSSILDDDIVIKASKFQPPTSFEQNIVPPGVLESYVTMVLEEDDEVKLTCAYNFPAVVLTIGRSNWHILKSLLQYLCDDIDWKVRKTIALSINFLALILGKEIATRDLVPIYLGFFKDLDEVKIEAIRNFANFLKAIDKSKHEEIFSNIGTCLRCDSRTNWRIKEDLAKEVCLVIKMYNSVENCDILLNLTSLTGYFLEDKVSCVREIAADAMAEIIRISNPEYKEGIVKYFLVHEFADSEKWRNRQTFLNVLYKYNLLTCSKLNPIKMSAKQTESPQLLSKSSSTASSSSDSNLQNNIKDVSDMLYLVFPSIEELSHDSVPNIRLFVAKYVVQLINVIGFNDDFNSNDLNILQIVRRLRHDKDCDVREIFDSVDLLKDEVGDESNLEPQLQETNLEQQWLETDLKRQLQQTESTENFEDFW